MFKSWVDHIIRHLRQYWEKYAKSYFLILVKMQQFLPMEKSVSNIIQKIKCLTQTDKEYKLTFII